MDEKLREISDALMARNYGSFHVRVNIIQSFTGTPTVSYAIEINWIGKNSRTVKFKSFEDMHKWATTDLGILYRKFDLEVA